MEKRLRMAFNIYDVDGDGKINALKLMVRGGLKEKSLMEAVNRTWIRMAQKGEEELMDFKEVGNFHRGCIFDRESLFVLERSMIVFHNLAYLQALNISPSQVLRYAARTKRHEEALRKNAHQHHLKEASQQISQCLR